MEYTHVVEGWKDIENVLMDMYKDGWEAYAVCRIGIETIYYLKRKV